MDFILLTDDQVDLAAYRFREHDNSSSRLAEHLDRIDATSQLRTAVGLQKVERQYAINLGTVCHKFLETEDGPTPRVQQQVMDYVAEWRELADGARGLLVSVDRIREIDQLAEGDGAQWLPSADF